MRLLIATAIALTAIAAPAAAQHLDARRSAGGIDEDHAYCRFATYPDLMLHHRVDGSDRSAIWQSQSRESESDTRNVGYIVSFEPRGETEPVFSQMPMLYVSTARESFPRAIAAGRVLVDGVDTHIALRVEGTIRMDPNSRNSVEFIPAWDDGIRLSALFLAGKAAQLDLLDDQGAVIRSYHWDIHKLRDAPLVLAQAHWACGDAVYK